MKRDGTVRLKIDPYGSENSKSEDYGTVPQNVVKHNQLQDDPGSGEFRSAIDRRGIDGPTTPSH
jgi:hypothetical protein